MGQLPRPSGLPFGVQRTRSRFGQESGRRVEVTLCYASLLAVPGECRDARTARPMKESRQCDRRPGRQTGLESLAINPIRNFREWFLAHTHTEDWRVVDDWGAGHRHRDGCERKPSENRDQCAEGCRGASGRSVRKGSTREIAAIGVAPLATGVATRCVERGQPNGPAAAIFVPLRIIMIRYRKYHALQAVSLNGTNG